MRAARPSSVFFPTAGIAAALAFVVILSAAACGGGGEAGRPKDARGEAGESGSRGSGPATGPGGSPSPGIAAHGGSVPGAAPGAGGASPADPAAYAEEVLAHRRWKDALFKSSSKSPAPARFRAHLAPLEYYPVDPSWRLRLPVIRYPRPDTFRLITNTGEARAISRVGRVEFGRDGMDLKLQLYREVDEDLPPEKVWVPFIDAGSGRETYPAGRYLDGELMADGTVLLDFNLAYNPYCAYGWNGYSCPLAPRENRLPIAVRAGEKGFHR